ncbi:hypothetical protein Tco_0776210 [Tanacetum coccineum]
MPYPEKTNTPYSSYGNKIFWKISNVVPTLRNPDTPYCLQSIRHLLKDQLLVYFDLKAQREVKLATEINNLTRQLLDIIDERRSFIGELEQHLPTNVIAYKTRQELKCHQKDDMIKVMEMRSTALQLHHHVKNTEKYRSLPIYVVIARSN